MTASFSRQIVNQTVSGLLIFWLSGLLLLFCCEMPQAQAAETETCPLAKTNHCAKQAQSENAAADFASIEADSRMLDCCRFLPNIFDKARKVESNQQTAVMPAKIRIVAARLSIAKASFNTSKFYQPFILNRGETYLKNQIFRI